jgi:cystathionine beta-lyase/cystathionine gamma-synthase
MPAASLPRATLSQKIEVLDYMKGPPRRSQVETMNRFKERFALSQATLSSWTHKESFLRAQFESSPNLHGFRRKPVVKHPVLMEKVENYIKQLSENGYQQQINDKLIRSTFDQFVTEMGIPKEKCVLSAAMIKSLKRRTLPRYNEELHPDLHAKPHEITPAKPLGQQNDTKLVGEHIDPTNSMALPQQQQQQQQQQQEQQQQLLSAPSLDFNFDEIFNNTTIGFNTRLIHPEDTFTQFLQAPITLEPPLQSMFGQNLTSSIQFQPQPQTQTQAQAHAEAQPNLISLPPFQPPSLQSPTQPLETSHQLQTQQLEQLQPNPKSVELLRSTSTSLLNPENKRNLPYYPTYDNPLNNSQLYKRQRAQMNSFNASIGSKLSNPNSEKVEKILENITDGHVTLYNSGTSAIMGVLSFLNPSHVYIDDMGYKGTHDVVKFLNKLTNVKKHSLSSLKSSSLTPTSPSDHPPNVPLENSVIIIESPMNPVGYVHDISYYSKLSQQCPKCKLIVDSTLAPPPLQFPFQKGADYVVYSAVKYLAGVSDLSAGFVVSKDKVCKATLHSERSALGTCIANFDSFLLLRSLRTYKMRILTQCQNTEKIITYLLKYTSPQNQNQTKPKNYDKVISKIYHASLQENKEIVMSQLNGYYNPVFALELTNDIYPEILLNKFNFLSNNPNLEGGETLVELIHGNPNFNNEDRFNPASKHRKMIRFSIGCEDYQDIIRDLDQALSSLTRKLS